MGKFIIFGIIDQSNDFFPLQIRQSFMVTVSKRFAHYFFHLQSRAFLIKFSKSVIIFLPINKLDIYWDNPFSYKHIIVYYPANTAITINKWMSMFKSKVQFCQPFDDIFLARGIILG